MELTEIPPLILKIFQYSTSTRIRWLVSILLVTLITIFSFDLLYAFTYNRIHNVEVTVYDTNYWNLMLITIVTVTSSHILFSLISYQYKIRKFGNSKYGVAIIPFDVISINPESLSSFEKMRTLDEVMHQLFLAIDLLLDDQEYSKSFDCRVLPWGLKIHNKHSSIKLLKKIGAILIIRGILREDVEGISLDLFFYGDEKVDLSETILLTKNAIDSIAKMIMISSYVTISMLKVDVDNKKRIDETIEKIREYLQESIVLYDQISNSRLDSKLRQRLEYLLDTVEGNEK